MNMRITQSGILPALAFCLITATSLNAAKAADKEIVEYRLSDWKTFEFEDKAKATAHADAIKKLGGEVRQEDHDGHIDVTYRCPQWKKISLKTHADAHEWEKWLKASGFETKHSH